MKGEGSENQLPVDSVFPWSPFLQNDHRVQGRPHARSRTTQMSPTTDSLQKAQSLLGAEAWATQKLLEGGSVTQWRHTMGTFPHTGRSHLGPLSPARSQRCRPLRQEAETPPFHTRLKPPNRNLLPEGKVLPQRRELFPLKFKPLVPRLIASCSRAQAPTPSPLPLPHFRALTSGLSGVRCPTPRASSEGDARS